MEMGILINAETDGASAEIQSCWELLCTKPHRTAPHRALLTGTASKGWHQAFGGWSRLRSKAQGSPHASWSQSLVTPEGAANADISRAPLILG